MAEEKKLIEDHVTPQFMPSLDLPTFKLHIAIDFGTDGIGLAYALDDEVYVHQNFNSIKYGATVKPKTIILFDNEGGVTIGMDAKFT